MDTHRIYINRAQVFDEGVTWTTVPGLYPHEYFPKDYVDAQAARIEALEAEVARMRGAIAYAMTELGQSAQDAPAIRAEAALERAWRAALSTAPVGEA